MILHHFKRLRGVGMTRCFFGYLSCLVSCCAKIGTSWYKSSRKMSYVVKTICTLARSWEDRRSSDVRLCSLLTPLPPQRERDWVHTQVYIHFIPPQHQKIKRFHICSLVYSPCESVALLHMLRDFIHPLVKNGGRANDQCCEGVALTLDKTGMITSAQQCSTRIAHKVGCPGNRICEN